MKRRHDLPGDWKLFAAVNRTDLCHRTAEICIVFNLLLFRFRGNDDRVSPRSTTRRKNYKKVLLDFEIRETRSFVIQNVNIEILIITLR